MVEVVLSMYVNSLSVIGLTVHLSSNPPYNEGPDLAA